MSNPKVDRRVWTIVAALAVGSACGSPGSNLDAGLPGGADAASHDGGGADGGAGAVDARSIADADLGSAEPQAFVATEAERGHGELAVIGTSTIAVVWAEGPAAFTNRNARLRMFDLDGELQTDEIQLSSTDPDIDAILPKVARAADGTAVIVWREALSPFECFQDECESSVIVRRYAADGAALSPAVTVLVGQSVAGVDVITLADGRWLVAAGVQDAYGGSATVRLRLLSADGAPIGAAIDVATNAVDPALVATERGGAFVVWRKAGGDGVKVRTLGAGGVLGIIHDVPEVTHHLSVSALPNDEAVVSGVHVAGLFQPSVPVVVRLTSNGEPGIPLPVSLPSGDHLYLANGVTGCAVACRLVALSNYATVVDLVRANSLIARAFTLDGEVASNPTTGTTAAAVLADRPADSVDLANVAVTPDGRRVVLGWRQSFIDEPDSRGTFHILSVPGW